MEAKSDFYLQKHQNEMALLKQELKLKEEVSSFLKTKDVFSKLFKLPFKSDTSNQYELLDEFTEAASTSSDNLLKDGIRLYHSVREIIDLSKGILHKIKS